MEFKGPELRCGVWNRAQGEERILSIVDDRIIWPPKAGVWVVGGGTWWMGRVVSAQSESGWRFLRDVRRDVLPSLSPSLTRWRRLFLSGVRTSSLRRHIHILLSHRLNIRLSRNIWSVNHQLFSASVKASTNASTNRAAALDSTGMKKREQLVITLPKLRLAIFQSREKTSASGISIFPRQHANAEHDRWCHIHKTVTCKKAAMSHCWTWVTARSSGPTSVE